MTISAPKVLPKLSNQVITGWLMAVALEHDRKAFERLYGQFAPKIKSYMIRQGADTAAADDLAQETMVQIWRKAEQYNPAKAAHRPGYSALRATFR